MRDERPSRRDRLIDVGWVVLLLGAAIAVRQRSPVLQVVAFAILIFFLSWQAVAS